MWYPFKKINEQKYPICSVTWALYLIFLFPKEFSTLITPFSTLLTMHLPFIIKTFFFRPSLPFSYCPMSFTNLTNFCKKLCYALSLQSNFDQFDQIIPPMLKMPTLQKRQVTFLLKQIILSILIDSFTVGIVYLVNISFTVKLFPPWFLWKVFLWVLFLNILSFFLYYSIP